MRVLRVQGPRHHTAGPQQPGQSLWAGRGAAVLPVGSRLTLNKVGAQTPQERRDPETGRPAGSRSRVCTTGGLLSTGPTQEHTCSEGDADTPPASTQGRGWSQRLDSCQVAPSGPPQPRDLCRGGTPLAGRISPVLSVVRCSGAGVRGLGSAPRLPCFPPSFLLPHPGSSRGGREHLAPSPGWGRPRCCSGLQVSTSPLLADAALGE